MKLPLPVRPVQFTSTIYKGENCLVLRAHTGELVVVPASFNAEQIFEITTTSTQPMLRSTGPVDVLHSLIRLIMGMAGFGGGDDDGDGE